MKKYRVNENEVFNLHSMYELLKCREIDLYESDVFDSRRADELEIKIMEVERLTKLAPCSGSLVVWDDLKRIREIKEERECIRHHRKLAAR